MFIGDQLRAKYLDFFASNGHKVIPSATLVPENDPSTLFTSSGMQPLVPYFFGLAHPQGRRVANSQKCFRTQDIEEVGDNRHTTFFEMLGNWSFGDYFKLEQLSWLFQFLTEIIGLDPAKLAVSAYRGDPSIGVPRDEEAPKIWQELFADVGLDAKIVTQPDKQGAVGRIYYYGDKCWWSRAGAPSRMPAGEPGGPDSEVFYDFGVEFQFHEHSQYSNQVCHPQCDCGRFLEIGNSVFMQYQKTESGEFVELKNKNVDFGGGFERLLAAANNDPDVFRTDLLWPIGERLSVISNCSYQDYSKEFRVIMDHVRAAIFLASDGVYPASKEQGYFARRLLRRAVRYGRKLGLAKPFLAEFVPVVGEIYRSVYPDIIQQQSAITDAITAEENKFSRTLDKGLREVAKLKQIDGAAAFKLYETYGFPLELTEEIAEEKGQRVDSDAFRAAFDQHKNQSRTASAGSFKGGLADVSDKTVRFHTATHLLHAALRQVLGESVKQMGSHITAERARFDFAFTRAMTNEEKNAVEQLINLWVKQSLPVTKSIHKQDEAIKLGAVAFFRERYPEVVSVYTIGAVESDDWVSKEFCGGPHVTNTAEIGSLKIIKEQSSSAGVRRIYLTFAE
ncbi:MAG TPA: alanine--tRNA ligase [Candidatus Woesebacteria bacterium]|nr:alanine--tRNA ligase [Candidatus Woesebacteria bacterium]